MIYSVLLENNKGNLWRDSRDKKLDLKVVNGQHPVWKWVDKIEINDHFSWKWSIRRPETSDYGRRDKRRVNSAISTQYFDFAAETLQVTSLFSKLTSRRFRVFKKCSISLFWSGVHHPTSVSIYREDYHRQFGLNYCRSDTYPLTESRWKSLEIT